MHALSKNAGQADTRVCCPASSRVGAAGGWGSMGKRVQTWAMCRDAGQEAGCHRASGLVWDPEVPRWQDVSRASERVSKRACVCLHSERQLSAVQRAGKAGPGAGSLSQLPFMHWQLETPSVPKSYSKGEVVGQLTTSQEPGKLAPLAFQQLGQLFCCVYPP